VIRLIQAGGSDTEIGRPSAFIAGPSAAFGKSFGKIFTPHNVMIANE
jgi:hypothetical protein